MHFEQQPVSQALALLVVPSNRLVELRFGLSEKRASQRAFKSRCDPLARVVPIDERSSTISYRLRAAIELFEAAASASASPSS
jgi:hypothetical protein